MEIIEAQSQEALTALRMMLTAEAMRQAISESNVAVDFCAAWKRESCLAADEGTHESSAGTRPPDQYPIMHRALARHLVVSRWAAAPSGGPWEAANQQGRCLGQ
jgi:hypothetical protein